jgi:transcriptional regulator with XRE-family HTH domain
MSNRALIGNKIKNIRESKGLSQERFGKKIGLTGKSVSAYENGKCTPPLKVLESISKCYGTAVFCFGNDNKNELEKKLQQLKDTVHKIEEILSSNVTI